MRDRFTQAMTGPFGFGRALLARQPIGTLTDWAPLLLTADTRLEQACQAVRQRGPEHAHDDILVWYSGNSVGAVPPAAIFDSVAQLRTDQASTDPLTGLANRRPFLSGLAAACDQVTARPGRIVLAFIDLDGMKLINDTRGHPAGDVVLIAVARGLRGAAPPDAIVARLGGDEFAVLTQITARDPHAGHTLGERLRQAVVTVGPTIAGGIQVRASVGVAVSGAKADAQTLLDAADNMMYRAKRSGGNRIAVIFQSDNHPDGSGTSRYATPTTRTSRTSTSPVHRPHLDCSLPAGT